MLSYADSLKIYKLDKPSVNTINKKERSRKEITIGTDICVCVLITDAQIKSYYYYGSSFDFENLLKGFWGFLGLHMGSMDCT